MNILAIDAATKTGWATLINGQIESGVQDFSLKRGESPGMRFFRFNAWLSKMRGEIIYHHLDSFNMEEETRRLDPKTYDLVVYEQAHHRGSHATAVGVGLMTRIQEFAAANGIEYTSVHTGELKKATVGKGNASKDEMCEWFAEKIGREPISDDEADAMALLYWAITEFNVEVPKQ
jgi:crossover junction endodeoxyribonuclease RuvC